MSDADDNPVLITPPPTASPPLSQQPPAPQHPWDLINRPAAGYRGHFIRPRGLLSANSPLRMSRGAASGVPVSFLAIVSLMLSVLVPPAGIVCGHIALARIRRLHQGGRPIALAGTILGYVVTALWAVAITLAIMVVSLRLVR